MEVTKIEIGEILKQERIKRKLTQSEVADILNITRSAYTRYETGQITPTIKALIELANLYNVSIDALVGRYQKTED